MNRRSVIFNLFWRYAEKCGAQIVTVIVSIFLARILEPRAFGVVAIVTVFINLLGVFVDSGLGNALIQKKNSDDLDFSSVFYANIVFCIILYVLLFFTAPYIAVFFENEDLTAMLRVLGITFLISGVRNIQGAYVSKHLLFKRFFFATLGGTIGAAILGVTMAFMGFGAWALIAQSLFNNAVDTIILWITVKWRPKKMFSFKRLKKLFSFGWKLLASSLLDTAYKNLRAVFIGKLYTPEDLAAYNKGGNWPGLVVENLDASINSILLPTMSNIQDDVPALKALTRRAIKTSTYIMAPLLIGLAAVGEPLVRLLLTEKWLISIPFMTIFCITYLFYPIHSANLNAIKALGRSDIFLKLEILKKVVGVIALLVTAPINVMAMGYSLLFTSLASQIINSWPNKKLLNYGYLEQLKDIIPGLLLALAMGCVVFPVKWLGLPDIVTLCIQVPLGAVAYIAGSKIFKLEAFVYLLGMLKSYLNNRKKKKNTVDKDA